MADTFPVAVVYVAPDLQFEERVQLVRGQTVADAVAACERARCVAAVTADLSFAVFGEAVNPDHVLQPGDRVELLRALRVDPKEARRRRARG